MKKIALLIVLAVCIGSLVGFTQAQNIAQFIFYFTAFVLSGIIITVATRDNI